MKILFVTKGLGWFRGTQRMFYECISHFKSSGHEVLAWGYGECGETSERLKDLGVKVLEGIESASDALDFHPDVVNIHRGGEHCDVETEFLLRFKSIGAKVIETSVSGRVDRECEGLIDLSIQISRWDLYRWNRWKGRLGVLGVYLPYIVDTDSFVRADECSIIEFKRRWNIPENSFIIGRAGKTSWENLSSSISVILDRHPTSYFVSVKDYNCPMPDLLLAHPRVRQIPRLVSNGDLSEFYSSCDVFVSASPFGESFGMVVAEAMACGTPVVATANPECDNAQAEVISHGIGGLLVARGEYIAKAIDVLIGDPELRNSFATSTRELTESRYSRKVVCKMLDNAFRLVISGAISDEFNKNGFDTDIPREEIKRLIRNVIGVYGFIPCVFQLQNLNWFWRRLYEIYDAMRSKLLKK